MSGGILEGTRDEAVGQCQWSSIPNFLPATGKVDSSHTTEDVGGAVYSLLPLSSSTKYLPCLLFSCSHYNKFLLGIESVF